MTVNIAKECVDFVIIDRKRPKSGVRLAGLKSN